MLVSVLCPSRGRPDTLRASIASLGQGDFEVLVALDADDPADYGAPEGGERFVVGPRHGYTGLHHYYDALVPHARGDWLFLWNDDVLMRTPNWLAVVAEQPCDRVLWPHDPGPNESMCTFPIVPRRWVEFVGRFSLSPHCDSWWEHIGRLLGRLERISVELTHDRADLTGHNDDATYREREYRSQEFEEMAECRERDAARILEHGCSSRARAEASASRSRGS